MDNLDIIKQWHRMNKNKQRKLAKQFGLTKPDDNSVMIASIWVLRVLQKGILDEFCKAVQKESS